MMKKVLLNGLSILFALILFFVIATGVSFIIEKVSHVKYSIKIVENVSGDTIKQLGHTLINDINTSNNPKSLYDNLSENEKEAIDSVLNESAVYTITDKKEVASSSTAEKCWVLQLNGHYTGLGTTTIETKFCGTDNTMKLVKVTDLFHETQTYGFKVGERNSATSKLKSKGGSVGRFIFDWVPMGVHIKSITKCSQSRSEIKNGKNNGWLFNSECTNPY